MFLDASAIVALLLGEDESQRLEKMIVTHSGQFYYSQIARFEAVTGIARAKSSRSTKRPAINPQRIEEAMAAVDEFFAALGALDVAVHGEVGSHAIRAVLTYGKNTGHPAKLNMGDCFAYACAKAYRIPLLYKGEDFRHTDIG